MGSWDHGIINCIAHAITRVQAAAAAAATRALAIVTYCMLAIAVAVVLAARIGIRMHTQINLRMPDRLHPRVEVQISRANQGVNAMSKYCNMYQRSYNQMQCSRNDRPNPIPLESDEHVGLDNSS